MQCLHKLRISTSAGGWSLTWALCLGRFLSNVLCWSVWGLHFRRHHNRSGGYLPPCWVPMPMSSTSKAWLQYCLLNYLCSWINYEHILLSNVHYFVLQIYFVWGGICSRNCAETGAKYALLALLLKAVMWQLKYISV